MANNDTNTLRPGDRNGQKYCIFQEVNAMGEGLKNFIAMPAQRLLPSTQEEGNFWKPMSIHDLHAGIS